MNYFYKIYALLICLFFSLTIYAGRSVFRTQDPKIPTIHISYNNDPHYEILQDSHLEQWPLFNTFDKENFKNNLLPENEITYRYDQSKTITGAQLSTLIQTAVEEIRQHKKEFSHFTIIRKSNFYNGNGLIILKFKEYPFVVKLFIETPQGYATPWKEGFESFCFFNMGGGMNRYMTGFTRIKNLKSIQARVLQHPYWGNKVSFPRKWFWTSSEYPWLKLESINLGTKTSHIELPSVYAVVADAIDIERIFSLAKIEDRRSAFAISSYLKHDIDSHIDNFAIEKETNKIVILDTEHFPTMLGLRHVPQSKSYLQWYMHLSTKMFVDTFCRTKQQRYLIQKREPSSLHINVQTNQG